MTRPRPADLLELALVPVVVLSTLVVVLLAAGWIVVLPVMWLVGAWRFTWTGFGVYALVAFWCWIGLGAFAGPLLHRR